MTCEKIAELLPDYFHQRLKSEERSGVETHLQQCGGCAEQVQLWKQLGQLHEEKPSPLLKKRFDAMLSAYEEGRWEHKQLPKSRKPLWLDFSWLQGAWPRAAQVAMTLLLIAVGFAAGRYSGPSRSHGAELQALHRELAGMRQLVVLSMLQQQSPSERLQGVSRSYQMEQADPEIITALIRALKTDRSVDVRLAALDSLLRYGRDTQVRRGVREALSPKQSPLVQIALIDALVEMRETGAVPQIRQLQQSPGINPAVRERASWGIAQLGRG
jgi:hypothetical protein